MWERRRSTPVFLESRQGQSQDFAPLFLVRSAIRDLPPSTSDRVIRVHSPVKPFAQRQRALLNAADDSARSLTKAGVSRDTRMPSPSCPLCVPEQFPNKKSALGAGIVPSCASHYRRDAANTIGGMQQGTVTEGNDEWLTTYGNPMMNNLA
jgi:hypothetical protein